MIRTISLGRYIAIQGVFVKALANGRIRIRAGERMYEGHPVT
ncbi:MAG: hypothetical protein ACU0CI_04390 [Shimia sp.]